MDSNNNFISTFGRKSVGLGIVKSHIICGMNDMVKLLNESDNIDTIAKYYVDSEIFPNLMSERQFGAAYMYTVFKMALMYAEHVDKSIFEQIDENAIKVAEDAIKVEARIL